ncbi:MAG: D-alanyl-D-alanine carboxypeptidase family protein [Gemmataceae bacterium]|nr:D-alanyl-D-alanine carboxypeptidase family protein [Gemmataceae bacterium]MCS7271177.1 D-alanyl-D-alanine carboxypeptidase family protein [Gemmataceae bacterium]MDW8241933.1 hypothetical protein [Thermogemmata sp.]
MPSRASVVAIVGLWLTVTLYSCWREWEPYVRGQGPPPVAIDLADEAAQALPIRWTVYRDQETIGRLTTQMKYNDPDDTFVFTHTYRQLHLNTAGVTVVIPELQIQMRINRAGDLLEQALQGQLEVRLLGLTLTAQARARGTVVAGQLHTVVAWESPLGSQQQPLPTTPVPRGQPLNPLLPVNRLSALRPGRRWIVHEHNPIQAALSQWLQATAANYGWNLSVPNDQPLIGEILREPQPLRWGTSEALCWIIEYRRDEELVGRTWVQTNDGRVLMQEAFGKGEHLRLVRDP